MVPVVTQEKGGDGAVTRCGNPAHVNWYAELAGRLPVDYLFNSMTIEGRPCVCGGMVWADPAAPEDGVKAHNTTLEHKAWIEAEGERESWGLE